MADDTKKHRARLAALVSSLGDFEDELEPLFKQSLAESTVELDSIQQAKLHVLLPYLVYDLVFIYLKTRSIEPKEHPVIAELGRVKEYFDKIEAAENAPKRALPLDKAAANRFIKHAINSLEYSTTTVDTEPGPSTHITFADDGTPIPFAIKVTDKMVKRAEWEQKLREEGPESEGEDDGDSGALQVFDEDEEVPEEVEKVDWKGKGKAIDSPPAEETVTAANGKRHRPVVDPFAGYGEDKLSAVTPSLEPKKKKKKKLIDAVDGMDTEISSELNTPQLANSYVGTKKTKKKKGGL